MIIFHTEALLTFLKEGHTSTVFILPLCFKPCTGTAIYICECTALARYKETRKLYFDSFTQGLLWTQLCTTTWKTFLRVFNDSSYITLLSLYIFLLSVWSIRSLTGYKTFHTFEMIAKSFKPSYKPCQSKLTYSNLFRSQPHKRSFHTFNLLNSRALAFIKVSTKLY